MAQFPAPPIRTSITNKPRSIGGNEMISSGQQVEGDNVFSRPWIRWYQSIATSLTAPVSSTPPATSASPGIPGQVSHDSNFAYFCVAQNTWKRAPLANF